jgi:hypothetical protein
MNLAFELLENLINDLPITIPRKDELTLYARQLKEAAYQAGRSEADNKTGRPRHG